jgi:hypothetical protein
MINVFEDAVAIYGDKAEKIEKILRRNYGYKNKQFNNKIKELDSYEKYYNWLVKELKSAQHNKDGDFDLEADISLIDKPIEQDIEYKKETKIKDEAIVDILIYLKKVLNPDRVRAIAARFNIDPDLYQLAGLGSLPENYNDEDVWKTMNISKNNPFYDHVWQPFYIESLKKLQELPKEIKQEIESIIEKSSYKREIDYPITKNKHNITYEAKLLENILINDNGMKIIPAGTYLNYQSH